MLLSITIALFLSFFIYPITLLTFWLYYNKKNPKEMGSLEEISILIRTKKTAQNLNILMIEESKTLVFAPNIISALTAIIAKYFEAPLVPTEVVLVFVFSHFSLIVLSTIGEAFLRMGLNRHSTIFIGSILMNWALFGGSILFMLQVLEFRSFISDALSFLLIFVVAFFLVGYGYFRMKESAKYYSQMAKMEALQSEDDRKEEETEESKFDVQIATSLEEAKKFLEDEYEKIDEFNGKHLYRKPKSKTKTKNESTA